MSSKPDEFEICILAGGLSQRMGKDKSRLRLGGRTMLGHIRAEAKRAGFPVRIIRRDLLPRCGPLGGIYTALKTTRARAILFMACDMPFIQPELLQWIKKQQGRSNKPLFLQSKRTAGFPFILPKSALSVVLLQLKKRQFSLRNLAKVLDAKIRNPPSRWRAQLHNVNTPEDWKIALSLWKK